MSDHEPGTEPPAATPVREQTATTATAVQRRPKTPPPRMDRLPPFLIVLHDDDVNDMLDVVHALIDLTPLTLRAATNVMFEAHRTGAARVLVTHKERAELYREQFACKGLTVTIEPA